MSYCFLYKKNITATDTGVIIFFFRPLMRRCMNGIPGAPTGEGQPAGAKVFLLL
jgi:hypothetical protein